MQLVIAALEIALSTLISRVTDFISILRTPWSGTLPPKVSPQGRVFKVSGIPENAMVLMPLVAYTLSVVIVESSMEPVTPSRQYIRQVAPYL